MCLSTTRKAPSICTSSQLRPDSHADVRVSHQSTMYRSRSTCTAPPDCCERINSGKSFSSGEPKARYVDRKGVIVHTPTPTSFAQCLCTWNRRRGALIASGPCGFSSHTERNTHPPRGRAPAQLHHHTLRFLLGSPSLFPLVFSRHPRLSFNGPEIPTRSRVIPDLSSSSPPPPPFRTCSRVDCLCLMHDGAEGQRYVEQCKSSDKLLPSGELEGGEQQ